MTLTGSVARPGRRHAGRVFGDCDWTVESPTGAVVFMRGEIDAVAIPSLAGCLDDVIAAGRSRVVLDLADVEFIDSVGLAAIVAARKRVAVHGGSVTLRRPSPPVRKLLDIVGLTGFLPVEG